MELVAVLVFLGVIGAIISEKVHRAAAAMTGAVILILSGVFDVKTAVSYIDFNTLGVLIGMMTFVAVVKNSGLFEFIAIKSAKHAKGDPWKILVAFTLITAIMSSFLDNVTTVLLVGPMTMTIARMLGVNPIPFIMTQIMAADIGGTATMIGDPSNIMIGSASHLTFLQFLANTGIVSVLSLTALILMAKFLYKTKLKADVEAVQKVMELDEQKSILDKALLHKSLIVMALVAIGFVIHDYIGVESCMVAMTAAVVMILIGRQNFEHIVAEVEWPTLMFFSSLFIVVGGMVETGVVGTMANFIVEVTAGHQVVTMLCLLWSAAIVSSFLDNVPFVATLIPLVATLGKSGLDIEPLWWAISLGACLGGNGTLIGASANVVLSGISNKHGYPITFKDYMKVGYPFMLTSIVIATLFLVIKYVLIA